jgi:hypothetical protein
MPILINVVVFILTIIATCKEQTNHDTKFGCIIPSIFQLYAILNISRFCLSFQDRFYYNILSPHNRLDNTDKAGLTKVRFFIDMHCANISMIKEKEIKMEIFI